jgi:hypothetical protein
MFLQVCPSVLVNLIDSQSARLHMFADLAPTCDLMLKVAEEALFLRDITTLPRGCSFGHFVHVDGNKFGGVGQRMARESELRNEERWMS